MVLPFDPSAPNVLRWQAMRRYNSEKYSCEEVSVHSHKIGADARQSEETIKTPWSGKIVASKRVRFAETSNNYYSDPLSFEEHQEMWHTCAEVLCFRKQASRYVKDVNKIEKNQVDALTFQKVFLEAYDACCEMQTDNLEGALSETQQHHLVTWMSIASDRWGLERPSVKAIYHDKSSRKRRIVRMVMEVQSMAEHLDVEVGAGFVRKAAERISRPSSLFARLLGEVHEAALYG